MRERVITLIVSYNTAGLLHTCLASLRAHAAEVPVVVVDNASADGTAAMVAHEFPEVRLVRNAVNVGFGAAVNAALPLLTSEFLFLLNSDAHLAADVVGPMIATLDRRPDAAAVGCALVAPAGGMQRSARRLPSARAAARGAFGRADPQPTALAATEYLDGAALLVRTADFRAVGGFDERFFLYAEDADLCRRWRDAGRQVLFDPTQRVIHTGGGSTERGSRQDDRRRWEALALYADKHFSGTEYAAYVLARAAELLRQIATHGARAALGDPAARLRYRSAQRHLLWHAALLRRRRLQALRHDR